MSKPDKQKVVGIVVTYQPKLEVLEQLLGALIPQVESVVMVDNGSRADLEAWNNERKADMVELLLLHENRGIAAALNAGIQWARDRQAEAVLLMDQDSIPATDMVEKLLSAMHQKSDDGINVAAVGPKYSDVKGCQLSPFVKVVGWRLHRIDCDDSEMVAVDHLISSGCLISMDVLNDIGGMEQKLFIDYVDIEWCIRATNAGYTIFGVGAAKMEHDLGDEMVNFFGRSIPVHSALRNYYLIRNGVWLLRQRWVPLDWKVMDLIRLNKIYLFFSLFAGTKFDNWKMMTKGVWHGITGQMGKYH